MCYEEIIAEGILCFSLSSQEVGDLTYREYNALMEQYNQKKRENAELERNIALNALINSKRKRNTQLIPLFKDSSEKTIDDILEERSELFSKSPFA